MAWVATSLADVDTTVTIRVCSMFILTPPPFSTEEIVGITPAVRSDSPEFPGFDRPQSPPNTTNLAEECAEDNEQQVLAK